MSRPERPTDQTGPVTGPTRSSRRALALPTVAGLAIAAVCLYFVVRTLVDQWDEVSDHVADANLGWLAVGFVLACAAMTWIAWCWDDVMCVLGHRPGRRKAVAWYYAGELGKYVPGGIWTIIGRAELARRGGIARSRAYPSVLLSLVALYTAGGAMVAVLVPLDLAQQSESKAALALLLVLPAGVLGLHPKVLTWGRDLVSKVTKRELDLPIPPWRDSLVLVARYLPTWGLVWGSTWAVTLAFADDADLLSIGAATMLSWVGGFVIVLVPAGAGVREAIFVAASGLSGGLAATVAITTRMLFLLADLLGAAVTAPWHRDRSETPACAAPDPAEP